MTQIGCSNEKPKLSSTYTTTNTRFSLCDFHSGSLYTLWSLFHCTTLHNCVVYVFSWYVCTDRIDFQHEDEVM